MNIKEFIEEMEEIQFLYGDDTIVCISSIIDQLRPDKGSSFMWIDAPFEVEKIENEDRFRLILADVD